MNPRFTWPMNRIMGVEFLARDMHAGAGIRGAGPARDHANAGLAGELAVGLGHHRRSALLAA